MDQRIVEFISALRGSGVRVSLAETADAFRAVEELGVTDRDLFRSCLRTTLIKDQGDIVTFEKLFPMFFQPGNPPPMMDGTQGLSKDDARKLAQALRELNQDLRQMIEKLMKGQQLTPQELQELDDLVNMQDVKDLRYQNMMTRQMEAALNFREVRQALEELRRLLNELGMNRQHLDRLYQTLQQNQSAMREQLRQHAGEQILRNLVDNQHHQPREGLLNRPFRALNEEDIQDLRREVRRLAAALRTRLALRLKRSRTGQLDVKATLRSNMKYGSVPMELQHRDHTKKPKIVVICDVSTSMRYCSELMLTLLYAIQDQISKTHAFTFIDHLEYVSPFFDHSQPNEAIEQVLRSNPPGYYNTDLGFSLLSFHESFLDTVDHRTTFIIVGDGRNNYNDPGIEMFKEISRRARSTIWLNPEPAALWGSGDSNMMEYAPLCSRTFQVGNMNQLASAIDQLLLH